MAGCPGRAGAFGHIRRLAERARCRVENALTPQMLTFLAAAMAVAWGVAHLVPTRSVVAGFGDLARANRLVLTQEWIAEGVSLIFVGVLAAAAGFIGPYGAPLSVAVRAVAAGMLVVMAILTALTGARTSVVFFKVCPLVKSVAALLLLLSITIS
jgi:hypothetical protein